MQHTLSQLCHWILRFILCFSLYSVVPSYAETATAIAPHEQQNTPRQSQQQGVQADQLILNTPVIDQANILSSEEKQKLTQEIKAIYQQGLAQIAVVFVSTTHEQPIFDYSMQIADKWKLGKKGVDNGLLIVVAVNDRNMYILTGYGLEGVLPDVIVKRIIRDTITPYFQQNDYAGGISAGIAEINKRLTTDPTVLAEMDQKEAELEETVNHILYVLIFGLFLYLILNLVTSWGVFKTSFVSSLLSGVLYSFFAGMILAEFIAVVLGLWICFLIATFALATLNGLARSSSGWSSSRDNDDYSSGSSSRGGGGYRGGGGGFGGGGAGGSW